jgi:hypothetical protein
MQLVFCVGTFIHTQQLSLRKEEKLNGFSLDSFWSVAGYALIVCNFLKLAGMGSGHKYWAKQSIVVKCRLLVLLFLTSIKILAR